MRVLVTGAAGFIGQALASALLSNPTVSQLILTDVLKPSSPSQKLEAKTSVECLEVDLTSKAACETLFTSNFDIVYLLHGLMSSAAEANLDLGLKVNIDSTRQILDILRQEHPGTKVVFASSTAVLGPFDGKLVTETTAPAPGSSYGAEKLICEILLNDFSRRGLLDGRILRLPTIIVRPGKPTGAASSFCSGIIREPLKGEKSQLPVGRSLELWVCSSRTVIQNLVFAKDIPSENFAGRSRVVNLPGITVSVNQMLQALKEVGGEEVLELVEDRKDEAIEKIVYSWPTHFDTSWAEKLGFFPDGSLLQSLRDYVEDYGSKVA